MRPFIVIRQFESADTVPRKELIKQYAMSFAFDAFTSCLFREVNFSNLFAFRSKSFTWCRKRRKKQTRSCRIDCIASDFCHFFFNFCLSFSTTIQIFIQLVVLIAAFMFIFLGLPLTICLMSLPLVVLIIYISVYSAYFAKALELSNVMCEIFHVFFLHSLELNERKKNCFYFLLFRIQ